MPIERANPLSNAGAGTVSDEFLAEQEANLPDLTLGVSQYLQPGLAERHLLPFFEDSIDRGVQFQLGLRDDKILSPSQLKEIGLS